MTNALNLMNLSHHAYCLIGGDNTHEELLAALKRSHKLSLRGNPDFFDRQYVNFTIDDAREVKSLAETKPTTEQGKKVFIIMTSGITIEAQNALLKLLEEPAAYSHFFLIIPSAHILLPTVKSRISIIANENKQLAPHADKELNAFAEKLIKSPVKQRLDMVKSFMDEIGKEKRPKQDAVDLLKTLEEIVYRQGVKAGKSKLEAILLAEKYATDRAPSMKMLLEYVALNL